MSNYSKKLMIVLVAVFLFLAVTESVSATTTMTFSAGSYVIDMSGFPYTYANGLKPYGLVYDLVRNKQIPVYWAINPSKAKDGIDFTVDSRNFRGGSFIIPAEYVSAALSTISTWTAKGVVVYGPTTSSFSAPIYDYITSFPNAVCDLQNGPIIIKAFYTPSEVPSTSYRLGSPQDLNSCDDIYAMPHADPQKWTTVQKTTFYNFINNGGFLWAACHAVSAMEAPTPTYLGYYFQSTNGLIPWGSHAGPVLPYSYNASSAKDPVMQFVGRLDNALQSGSEKVYLPRLGSGWRSTSTVAVWDPGQTDVLSGNSPGPAGIVIYGRAFGDPAKGFIVYEASHSLVTGNTSENVDAARVYGNTLLLAGIQKRPSINVTAPTTILSGQTVSLSATVSGGQPPYTVTWISSAGGTFANPHALSTTYTAPTVAASTNIILRLTVTDACNRFNFYPKLATIVPKVMTLSKTDFKTVTVPEAINNYTIYYNNTGSVSATGVVVTDRLHPELTYIPTAYPAPASVVTNVSGTYLTWNIGTVTAGSTKKILLNASVKDSVTVGTNIINDVSLTYTAYSTTVMLSAQDVDGILPVTKQVNKTTALAGDYLKYDLCPKYDGIKFLTNAKVIDVIPDYTTYVTGSVNASGTYYSNRTIIWNLGSDVAGTPGKVTASPAVYGYYRNVSVNDTDLRKDAATQNDGSCTTLEIDGGGNNNDRRAILYFRLPTLPSNAVMDSALLDVYVTDNKATNVNVYRMNRSWCLAANSVCNNCTAGLTVEGIKCNAEPDNNYGATWSDFNHRKNAPAISCPWSRVAGGGDYVSTTVFGTFNGNIAGRNTAAITNLVRGWYNGTYAVQGILLDAALDQRPKIGSRENTDTPDKKPYLNVSYHIPSTPGTNVSITAHPLLNCDQSQIKVNMTVNATQSVTVNPPATLTVTGTNGATATLSSGPTPPGPVTMLANTNYYFNYVFNANPGANPGTLKFTGKPTYTGTPTALFNNGTSNTIIITPYLSYKVRINTSTPSTVSFIWNNATFKDSSVIPAGVLTNTTTTSLVWPAAIKVSKSVNPSSGSYCTNTQFVINVTNTGKSTLNPVTVVDSLPAGLNYVSSNNSGSEYLGNITWNIGPMIAGQKKYLSLVAHIDGTVYGILTNHVNANGTAPNGTFVTSQATQTVTAQKASIAVTKSSNVTTGPPCTYVKFSVNVTNNGQATLNPVTVEDLWGDGLTYKSSNATTLDLANDTIYWSNIGPMTAGQTKRLDIVVHIDGSYFGETSNAALVSGKPPSGSNVSDYNFTTVYAQEPIITVNKTVNLTQGAPSTRLNFTIKVTNVGEVTMNPVKVVDTLPYGLNYISSNGSAVGNVITWTNIGPLSVGQSKNLYLIAHINGSAYGALKNIVNVTATSPTGLKYYSNDTRNVTALTASIAATKAVNLTEGATCTKLNFTINVTNTGQAALNPVTVVDTLPYGLKYVSSNGTAIGNVVTWSNIGPMTTGQLKSLYLIAHINGSAYGPLNNTVNVTGKPQPAGDNVTAQAFRIVTAKRASIAVIKTSNVSSGVAGAYVNFTLNVTNTGEVTLNPTKVVDTLPYGLAYVSSNGTAVGNIITWSNIGPLTAGQSKKLYLVAQINGSVSGPLHNLVTVQGTPPTGNNVTNSSEKEVIALEGFPEITVMKDADPTQGVYLQNITFEIEVANSGSLALNPVKVVDILPTGLTYLSDDAGGSAAGKVITWNNVGPLASGDFIHIHVVAFIDGDQFGNLTDYANATGTPTVGDNVTSNDTAVVDALYNPNINITKIADPTIAGPGDNVTFIINATNTGNIPLPTVRVVDVLPVNMVYVSDNRSGTVSGNIITWSNVGPLVVNESTYIQLNATVTL